MDAGLKVKWVEALRGEEFKQARGTLHNGEAYCCLGVLCRVAGIPIEEDGSGVIGVSWDKHSYQPIFDLVGGVDVSHALSMRNDGSITKNYHPHTFAEIADYIEKHL